MGELRLYEHSATRRRIALDALGGAYRWCADARRYCRAVMSDTLVATLV
jgi:hypothetical protein